MTEKTMDLSTIDFHNLDIHGLNIIRSYLGGNENSNFSTEEIVKMLHISNTLVYNELATDYGEQSTCEYYATLKEYEPKARLLLANHNDEDIDRLQELMENELKRREEIEKAKDPNYIPF